VGGISDGWDDARMPTPQGTSDIWEVIGALATTGAVVAALGFGVWSELRLHHEREERKKEAAARAEDDAKAQASQVSSWTHQHESGQWQALIQNESSEPIWDLSLPKRGDHNFAGREDIESDYESFRIRIPVLPPHTTDQQFVDPGATPTGLRHPWHIQFRDNNGTYWVRDSHGNLVDHNVWVQRIATSVNRHSTEEHLDHLTQNADFRFKSALAFAWKQHDAQMAAQKQKWKEYIAERKAADQSTPVGFWAKLRASYLKAFPWG